MEPKEGKTLCPSSAECGAGSCEKTGVSRAEKEELNEDRSDSLFKHISQTSISQKQTTADGKLLKDGVQGQPSRKRVSYLDDARRFSESSTRQYFLLSSLRSSLTQPSKHISSAQSIRNHVSQQSPEPPSLSLYGSLSTVSCSKTKSDMEEKSTTSAHPSAVTSCSRLRFFNGPSLFNPPTSSWSITTSDVGPLYPEESCDYTTDTDSTDSDCDKYESSKMKASVKGTVEQDMKEHIRTRRLTEIIRRNLSRGNSSTVHCNARRQDETSDGGCFLHTEYENLSSNYEGADCLSTPSPSLCRVVHLENRQRSTLSRHTSSQFTAPTVARPPCPQRRHRLLHDSTVSTEESRTQDAFELLSVQSESNTGAVSDAPVEMDASVTAENYSAAWSQVQNRKDTDDGSSGLYDWGSWHKSGLHPLPQLPLNYPSLSELTERLPQSTVFSGPFNWNYVSGSYQALHEKSDLRDLGAGPSSAQRTNPGNPGDFNHYSGSMSNTSTGTQSIIPTKNTCLVLAADSHLQQPFDGSSPVNSPVSSSSYKQKKGNWRSYRRMKKIKNPFYCSFH
ncbi:uncharacterized protein LOC127359506 [Dicentrarchus labrax]|uniref:uncharacterized protein LOC127359506 n=1 Tax=Dicentrarchus labrax TaxID=13489 RepID=UPI0021F5D0E7|nr:uncharacterized protein LOC127359506 [Dicentrarchus labrax]